MKKLLTILVCFAASVIIVMFVPHKGIQFAAQALSDARGNAGLFNQKVESIAQTPVRIKKIFNNGELVGIISDARLLEQHYRDIYKEKYEENFPDSRVYLAKDMYEVDEQSYMIYENRDQEILDYLDRNSLYSLKATAVLITDDEGERARFFVSNEALYEEAFRTYVTMFVSEDVLELLAAGENVPELTTYGTRDMGISIPQTVTLSDDYAAPEEIKITAEEVIEYLEYGDNTEREYYTVQEYDTCAGVGSKNNNLTASMVMNINRDKISSVDQVLPAGEQLCVSPFTPVIDVIVYKEALRAQDIYYTTDYIDDSSMLEGEVKQIQPGIDGSKNSLFQERWINGVLDSGTEKSSVITRNVQNEIIAVGTMKPDVGTGTFRFPVDNPIISCPWGCYYGHRGTDVQNRYNLWGKVLAADRGVIMKIGYDGISGNYVIIDHKNGYESYYGHMRVPCPLAVGTVVDKGQEIGDIGMTGLATGPHVHFFINENGNRRDACTILNCNGLYAR